MGKLLTSIGWLVVVGLCWGMAGAAPATLPANAPAAVVGLHGEINSFSRGLFERHFNQAKAVGATVIIVDINSFGGTVTDSLQLSQFIKSQHDVQTIAFVNPRAISGGSMVALACNQIVMTPTALLGDCAPIQIGPTGLVPMPDTERSKTESIIKADFQDSAQRNGYSEQVVLLMVSLNNSAVYWIERKDGSERRFVDEPTYTALTVTGAWKPVPDAPDALKGKKELLTVYTSQAQKLGLAKGTAYSIEDLLGQRNLRLLGTFESGAGEALIEFFNNDVVRFILLSIFFTCLYVALHAPGHGAAEVIAVVTLSLLLGVPLLTGYAQWWEILLIFAGIALLALELFVIPGFGFTGILGVALIFIGFLLTFIAPEPGRSPFSIPRLPMTWQSLQNGLMTMVAALIASLVICWWLRRLLPRLPIFNRLILNTVVGSTESAMVGTIAPVQQSTLPPIGSVGKVVTDLRPGGLVEFRNGDGLEHNVSAVSSSGFLGRGEKVVVRQVSDSHVIVHKVQA